MSQSNFVILKSWIIIIKSLKKCFLNKKSASIHPYSVSNLNDGLENQQCGHYQKFKHLDESETATISTLATNGN